MANNNNPSLDEQVAFYNSYWKDLKPFGDYKLQRVIEILKILRKLSKIKKNPKILDFGCGDGRSVPVWSLVGPADGFDLSETAMKEASLRYPYLNFKYGDACNSTYDSDKYDIVISQEVIEHIIDQDKYLEECNKLLLSNGFLILTTPNKFYFDRLNGGNYSRQPIENLLYPTELKKLVSKKFKIKSCHSLIQAKGDFGIYKFISNRYVQFLVKRLGLSNWFYALISKKLLNLHLVVVAQKK